VQLKGRIGTGYGVSKYAEMATNPTEYRSAVSGQFPISQWRGEQPSLLTQAVRKKTL
jgi:hypothetical protein